MEESLGNGYVRLRVAEAERRQAKHDIRCVEDAVIEMLRNARDAGASHIFVALTRDENLRRIVVLDDGQGIPLDMHTRVFDARVTSKLDSMNMDRWGVHGRGMALYSIKENALDCGVVASDVGLGASLTATFDIHQIRERADQSTWPKVQKTSKGTRFTGPHNIVRTCVEFGLDVQGACKVYVGSPAEIVATMRERLDPYATDDANRVPYIRRFAGEADAQDLCALAAFVGLEMSERTSYRIVRGEIRPLRNVVLEVLGSPSMQRAQLDALEETRRLVLTQSERKELAAEVSKAFERIAGNYYFEIAGSLGVRIADGLVTVSIPYAEVE